MSKHTYKPSASNTDTSRFSDTSRVFYRQQNLSRRLKKIQQQNTLLQSQIKLQQTEINSQRTIVMYHLTQLTKGFKNKLKLIQNYKITRSAFMNEQQAHDLLKQLITKFQQIQQQQLMLNKIRTNIETMFDIYLQHQLSIQTLMTQSALLHKQTQSKIKSLIQQKKSQLNSIQFQNTNSLDSIARMKLQILQFKSHQQSLTNQQLQLKKLITNKQQQIYNKLTIFQNLTLLTSSVIDKKYQHQLCQDITTNTKQLSTISNNNHLIEIALNQELLKSL